MAGKATWSAWYTQSFLLADRSTCCAVALFASCLGWFVMFETSTARADEHHGPLSEIIHVVPHTTCVDAAQLVEQVELWLAGDAVDRALRVDVLGSDPESSWVEFTLRRGPTVIARRRFEPLPSRCDMLEATLSLSIALALKVSLIDDFVPSRTEAPTREPEVPAPKARSSQAPVDVPRARRAWALTTALRLTRGVAPTEALGAGLTTSRLFPRQLALLFGIEGHRARSDLGPGGGTLSVGMLAARLDGCATLGSGSDNRLRGCLGTRVGAATGRGDGFPVKRSVLTRWAAASAALGLSFALYGPWSLDLSSALLVSLTPTRFEVRTRDGARVAARALPALGGELTVGPQYRF